MSEPIEDYWSLPVEILLQKMGSSPQGLSQQDAARRLAAFGHIEATPSSRPRRFFLLLLEQYKSPIILLLLAATGLSIYLGDVTDALIIFAIVLVSGLLSCWQEWGATEAVNALMATVAARLPVRRDGTVTEITAESIAPGDIVMLASGRRIPADCVLLESQDLHVDEAALTGEMYPVEKMAGVSDASASLSDRNNVLYMGTHVVSGSATAVVVKIRDDTEFGKITFSLRRKRKETDFEHGIRLFGYFLLEVTLLLVLLIFAFNIYLGRPSVESFLFSLALAVGLTPQLLPAVISVNLARGARQMAQSKVIVKRLAAIENFGSMDLLCSDKTGTLTEGEVRIRNFLDPAGKESDKVRRYAFLNAYFESGFSSPIDEALRALPLLDTAAGCRKERERPYDFTRKRLSITFTCEGQCEMTTKGALIKVLEVCTRVEQSDGIVGPMDSWRQSILDRYQELAGQGYRTLGVAYKGHLAEEACRVSDETDMVFLGFVVLYDPPKAGVREVIERLNRLGVSLKVITGDSLPVTGHLLRELGVENPVLLSGAQMRTLSSAALLQQVQQAHAFAEVEPNQKEQIVQMLRKAGHVVGFMGDGINDAAALHAADVSLSVDSAVDVAKEAADIVLLEKDLAVLTQGVIEGRKTFANTLKYVFMATSANFGNMFSMAGASLFLSFLPLLPKQILLTNLLTDLPEMTIAGDTVDDDMIARPHRWDLKFIRRFMLTFGLLSSVFDFLTFGVLLYVLKATPELFRTGWFIESVVSAACIVLVVRSRKPILHSVPSRYLVGATGFVVLAAVLLPLLSGADTLFAFTPPPFYFLAWMGLIVIAYIMAAEFVKKQFYRREA
ncbi:MAG: magnesium-translocating P-type ATPase [Negativicutes bacterium]